MPSVLLWGPPGCGKTTALKLLAKSLPVPVIYASPSIQFNAIRQFLQKHHRVALLFDEIHRLSRTQQDFLLKPLEEHRLILLASTTENPSVSLSPPLLSRLMVVEFKPLSGESLKTILDSALHMIEEKFGLKVKASEEAVSLLVEYAWGDARKLLQLLELIIGRALRNDKGKQNQIMITVDTVKRLEIKHSIYHSVHGDERYNLISALIKSIRGSDPHAAIYWLARLIKAGEDPLYIARRLVISASEDIGLADPFALVLATACYNACSSLGYPECSWALAQTTIYLATAPKSNSAYKALKNAFSAVEQYGPLPVPLHIRNPVTKWLKEKFKWGKEYLYPHDFPGNFVPQQYLPDEIKGTKFYEPVLSGLEKKLWQRFLKFIQKNDSAKQQSSGSDI